MNDINQKLPPYLVEMRYDLMSQLKKRGLSNADIGRVFRISPQYVNEIFDKANQIEEGK